MTFVLDQDGAEPCGNSVSVHNLIRLAAYLDREDLKVKAGKILTAFSDKVSSIPIALPEMTSALMHYHGSPTQVSAIAFRCLLISIVGAVYILYG